MKSRWRSIWYTVSFRGSWLQKIKDGHKLWRPSPQEVTLGRSVTSLTIERSCGDSVLVSGPGPGGRRLPRSVFENACSWDRHAGGRPTPHAEAAQRVSPIGPTRVRLPRPGRPAQASLESTAAPPASDGSRAQPQPCRWGSPPTRPRAVIINDRFEPLRFGVLVTAALPGSPAIEALTITHAAANLTYSKSRGP